MTTHYSRKNAAKAARAQFFLRPVSQVLTFASFAVLVRLLPEREFGIYSLLLSSLAMFSSLLSLGLGNMVQRYVPEYAKAGEFTRAKRLAHAAMILRQMSILTILAITAIFIPTIIRTYALAGYEYLFIPLVFILMAQFQSRMLTMVLQGLLYQKAALWGQVAFALVKMAAYATIWLAGGGLAAVMWAELGANLVMLAILTINYRHRVIPLSGGPSALGKEERKRVAKYALFYNFNDVGVFGLGRDIDNFFLGAMVSPLAVGAYSFAGKLTDFMMRIAPVSFFYSVVQPMFFTLDRENEKEKASILFSVLVKMNFVFIIPFWAIASAIMEPMVRVFFGGKFEEYSTVVIAVMGLQALSAISNPIGLVAQLHEKAHAVLLSKITSLLNLVLNFMLVPHFGIWGVVWATGICTTLRDIIVWMSVREYAPIFDWFRYSFGTIAIWSCFIFGIRAITTKFIGNDIIAILIGGSVGALVAILYLRFSVSYAPERDFLLRNNLIPTKARRLLTSVSASEG